MRSITLREPTRQMFNPGRDMERFINSMWGGSLRDRSEADSMCGTWVPPVNILERENGIEITVEMPGIEAQAVDVTVEDGVLSIKGERQFEEAAEGETYHRVESSFGAFERRFTVPTTVDSTKIEATFKNGVMTLALPKREESKPRTVKVKVEAN
ncbi:MAG: Hsp20/alpha crystallin family protein [Acidobacteria bacterium]|nr:MAG: Hsp20/alpha crystallin family protein [Acidobacteriota bacterium]